MKRISLIILTAILVMALTTSCVSSNPQKVDDSKDPSVNSSEVDNQSSPSKGTDDETFSIGDVIKLNDWNVTVNAMSFEEKIAQSEYFGFTPDEGNVYLVLDITVKNVGTKADCFLPSFTLNNSGVKIIYDGTYEYSSSNLLGYDKDLHDKQLNPLTELNGIIAFSVVNEVKDSNKPLVVRIVNNNVKLNIKLR